MLAPTPAAAAPAVKSVVAAAPAKPVKTTIAARVDVGFGNALFLRGEGPGLSWDVGLPMQNVGADLWQVTLQENARAYTFKFLVNDVAAALDKTVADGTYYWRVRGLTAKDRTGPWSRVWRVVKRWNIEPLITGGDGAEVSWPRTPLELSWSAVPHANKYIVSVATDPTLSNLVLGSAVRPFETQGVHLVMPISLAPGVYYFAVTPVDAEGRRGARSAVASFSWTWPTTASASPSSRTRWRTPRWGRRGRGRRSTWRRTSWPSTSGSASAVGASRSKPCGKRAW